MKEVVFDLNDRAGQKVMIGGFESSFSSLVSKWDRRESNLDQSLETRKANRPRQTMEKEILKAKKTPLERHIATFLGLIFL